MKLIIFAGDINDIITGKNFNDYCTKSNTFVSHDQWYDVHIKFSEKPSVCS